MVIWTFLTVYDEKTKKVYTQKASSILMKNFIEIFVAVLMAFWLQVIVVCVVVYRREEFFFFFVFYRFIFNFIPHHSLKTLLYVSFLCLYLYIYYMMPLWILIGNIKRARGQSNCTRCSIYIQKCLGSSIYK